MSFCDLGEVGKTWVRSCLSSGKLLSRHVIARVNLDPGVVLAVGWDGPEVSDPSVLEHGIPNDDDLSAGASAVALLDVLHHIEGDFASASVVVENDLAKPDDPAILNRPVGSIIITDDVVYHWKRLSELDSPETLMEFLGSSSSGYPLNGFVVRSVTREQIVNAFAQHKLGAIVEHIEAIINSIFDNEGFSILVLDRSLVPLSS